MRVLGAKIADAGSGIEEQALFGGDAGGQGQRMREILSDGGDLQVGIREPQPAHRGLQIVGGDIDGHVVAGAQAGEEAFGLDAVARTQVDHRLHGADVAGDVGAVALEDLRFAPGRVVLRQLGNGREKGRAERVVQELGIDVGRMVHQPVAQFDLFRTGVLQVPSDEFRRGGGKQGGRGNHAFSSFFRGG
ncbi:hypothetical protein D9M68_672100 [compost metagenome]